MKTNLQIPPKKKVFFVLSSLTSGGSERVFWSLTQGINKQQYDIALVILNSKVTCFSTDLDQVRIIDLNTGKASRSFFALYKLFKEEKPYAVFSTMGHMNILISLVAVFLRNIIFVARVSNVPTEHIQYETLKSKFYALFAKWSYKAFNIIVCQTEDMRQAIKMMYKVNDQKTVVIPNPVVETQQLKVLQNSIVYKLIVVARFSREKGLDRLIDVFSRLPSNYHLSMVGIGVLEEEIRNKVRQLGLDDRVKFFGEIKNVPEILVQHDLMVLSSYTEGFPNVVAEALAVGLPVVTFKVSGVKELIKDGFNGYVVPQDDLAGFRSKIIQACTNTSWNFKAIKDDVYRKFNLEKISEEYEQLIN
ncbi:MAG TPA: glycosyltransferase [Sphingobacterium bovisgrunnientis]|nr:glycosyltransferase [Sphingobacterium bovisgrunnientis]